jgi:hypothetical protein
LTASGPRAGSDARTVIDPVAAAVEQAEALIVLRTIKVSLSSFRRSAPKATTGLSPTLTAYWEGAQ